MNKQERKKLGIELQEIKEITYCQNCSNPVSPDRKMFQLITEETENNWVEVKVKETKLVCRDCAAENQDHTVSEEEQKKRIEWAKAHLEEIADLPNFRNQIEEAEKENTLEAFKKLEQKLARELFEDLVQYKGGNSAATVYSIELNEILNGIEAPEKKWKRIRNNTKDFLESDKDVVHSETLRKLAEEAIAEDTMDGYYNLLKSFRKSYDELVQLKGNEDNADKFLEQLTNVVHDKNKWK
ncbi:hypothetical protein [endosymbiont GvMRE of Glomus versiforme]|uniref:hypothetical protein n=1 Tax=endosymbiont GvMRE of Glomus versiforme TaxID=2039283 RepID=UPI000EC5EADF|nr:hypothetical protein [endosymbiont GvMRE of Glomus versiforme]RHZ36701.1 hypothetical protein GvMRE_I2g63 [endosymbiont GvMRE of Glomus versiforme]